MNEITRRRFFKLSAGTAFIASSGCFSVPKTPNSEVVAELNRQIRAKLIAGGVCGLSDGQPLCVAGCQTWTPRVVPMAENSLFDTASVGKTFTASLCALLAADGRLDPDAPFTHYLPEHVLAKGGKCAITVRDLATHTGGFDNAKPYILKDPAAFDRALFAKRPARARGVKFEYACSNFIYLGKIVERLTGLDLETAAKRMIWEPLGMTDTCWHDIPGHPRAVQSVTNGNIPPGTKGDEAARIYPKALGNGAAFSTASDLLKFTGDLARREKFPKAYYDLLLTCCYERDGDRRSFGWDMRKKTTPQGWSDRTVNHGGYTGNTVAVDPECGRAGVVLTNRTGDWWKGYEGRMRLLTQLEQPYQT